MSRVGRDSTSVDTLAMLERIPCSDPEIRFEVLADRVQRARTGDTSVTMVRESVYCMDGVEEEDDDSAMW